MYYDAFDQMCVRSAYANQMWNLSNFLQFWFEHSGVVAHSLDKSM